MDKPQVSIIVPAYNTEDYLRKCVDSILNQMYKDLEVILVDDGSSDRSGEICDEYAKNDARVRVIHKGNGGLSDARNAGIDALTGDYLMFVDSDDFILPEMTTELMNKLINNDADMSLCSFTYIDEDGVELASRVGQSPIKDEVLSGLEAVRKLAEPYHWYYVVAWAKVYRKYLFDSLRFPKGKIHEDVFVMHHLMGECRTISCVPEKYYQYVQRTGSIMSGRNALTHLHEAEALLDRARYVYRLGMTDFASKLYASAGVHIGCHYKEETENAASISESDTALRTLRGEAYLLKYCAPKERIRTKLICFSPKVYQFLLLSKQHITGIIRR